MLRLIVLIVDHLPIVDCVKLLLALEVRLSFSLGIDGLVLVRILP